MLVFPNYVCLPRPAPPPRPGRTVLYRCTGPLEEIYWTLVVRLHYRGLFLEPKRYRQAADFPTATGKLAALTLREAGEQGELGELEIFFGPGLDPDVQAAFQKFVDEHLRRKATDVERLRKRPFRDMGTRAGKTLRSYTEEFPRKHYQVAATRTGY